MTYSPSNWSYVRSNVEKAYTSDTPTLHEIADKFGDEYSKLWVRIQITALYGASSNSDVGIADGIKIFSECFAEEVKGFKLTELMLFFSRYKAGVYDNSYSSFDSRRIGNAFFKEFIPQRNQEIDKIERNKARKEMEESRPTFPEGYTSLTWYEELKRRAASGDKWAKDQLYK